MTQFFAVTLPRLKCLTLWGFIISFVESFLPVRTGLEEMMGQEALVIEDIDPEGKVRFKDEIWAARAKGERLEQGEKARIVISQGLVLVVANTGEKSNSVEERLTN